MTVVCTLFVDTEIIHIFERLAENEKK
jgi:hypothetical protein